MKRRHALAGLAAAVLTPPFPARSRSAGQAGDTLPWADLEPLPPGTRARFTDLTRVTGEVVPNDEFFVLQHGEIPEVSGSQRNSN